MHIYKVVVLIYLFFCRIITQEPPLTIFPQIFIEELGKTMGMLLAWYKIFQVERVDIDGESLVIKQSWVAKHKTLYFYGFLRRTFFPFFFVNK